MKLLNSFTIMCLSKSGSATRYKGTPPLYNLREEPYNVLSDIYIIIVMISLIVRVIQCYQQICYHHNLTRTPSHNLVLALLRCRHHPVAMKQL